MYYLSFFSKVFVLMLFIALFVVATALVTVIYDGLK